MRFDFFDDRVQVAVVFALPFASVSSVWYLGWGELILLRAEEKPRLVYAPEIAVRDWVEITEASQLTISVYPPLLWTCQSPWR